MIQLQKEDLYKLEQWKDIVTDSTCYTVMQGLGGSAWVDDRSNLTGAALVYGDLCFLLGEAVENAEVELLNILKKSDKTWSIFVPNSESWDKALEEETTFTKNERYLIKKKQEPFNKELLESYAKRDLGDFQVKQIDAYWYQKALGEEWSKDLCSNFATAEDYVKHGLGFVIVKDDKVAAGISSYAYYDKGIEIEIDTKEEFRKRGFATVLGATMILECMKRGLYPHWDAANMVSVRTAKKLGYEYDRPYNAYSNVSLKTMQFI